MGRLPDGAASAPLTAAEAEARRTDGWALYEQQPRELQRVIEAARALEQAARALTDDYRVQVQAAQALAFVAENAPQTAGRVRAAEQGVGAARRARELQPAAVEGHYWYAINVGLLADADRSYGLSAVAEMEPALQQAIAIDEGYDYAGPVRVLGILHLRTPGPPVSIGSTRKGLRLLQRAVALAPDYPENHLYLAEAQQAAGKREEALVSLQKVLRASPWPDREWEATQWQATARRLDQQWRKE